MDLKLFLLVVVMMANLFHAESVLGADQTLTDTLARETKPPTTEPPPDNPDGALKPAPTEPPPDNPDGALKPAPTEPPPDNPDGALKPAPTETPPKTEQPPADGSIVESKPDPTHPPPTDANGETKPAPTEPPPKTEQPPADGSIVESKPDPTQPPPTDANGELKPAPTDNTGGINEPTNTGSDPPPPMDYEQCKAKASNMEKGFKLDRNDCFYTPPEIPSELLKTRLPPNPCGPNGFPAHAPNLRRAQKIQNLLKDKGYATGLIRGNIIMKSEGDATATREAADTENLMPICQTRRKVGNFVCKKQNKNFGSADRAEVIGGTTWHGCSTKCHEREDCEGFAARWDGMAGDCILSTRGPWDEGVALVEETGTAVCGTM